MSSEKISLTNILGNFDESALAGTDWSKKRPITLWVPEESKVQYDRVQKKTRRILSKKMTEAAVQMIAAADAELEQKAS